MKQLNILIICLLILFVYMNILRKRIHLDKIKSDINNIEYYVRDLPDKKEAADKLANISMKFESLVKSLQSSDKERSADIKRLQENFKSEHITENIPGSMYTAYSVNKGEELSLCIREKDTEKFMDDNIIIFVAIHELSHIMTEETGHTERFWDNMSYLLEKGSLINIYSPVDYSVNPRIYCGIEINSTPLKI